MAQVAEFQRGDVGAVLRLTIKDGGSAVNISGASAKKFELAKPDGTLTEVTAVFVTDGTDGKLKWTTTSANDLDQAGPWSVQAKITDAGGPWRTRPVDFYVNANLGD